MGVRRPSVRCIPFKNSSSAIMPRRRNKGNARQKLQKALKEQRYLEGELNRLTSAADVQDSCQEIIKHVQSTAADPMTMSAEEGNAFKENNASCSCLIMWLLSIC